MTLDQRSAFVEVGRDQRKVGVMAQIVGGADPLPVGMKPFHDMLEDSMSEAGTASWSFDQEQPKVEKHTGFEQRMAVVPVSILAMKAAWLMFAILVAWENTGKPR